MPTSKKDKVEAAAVKTTKPASKTSKPKSKAATPKKRETAASKKTTQKKAAAPKKAAAAKKTSSTAKKSAAKETDSKKPRAKSSPKSTAKPKTKAATAKKSPSKPKEKSTTKAANKPSTAKSTVKPKSSTAKPAKTSRPKAAAKTEEPKASQEKVQIADKPQEETSTPESGPATANKQPKAKAKNDQAKRGRNKGRTAASSAASKTTQKARPQKNPRGTKSSSTEPKKNQPNNRKDNEAGNQGYKLLINADSPEECRVALLEKGKLTSFHVETVVSAQHKGNIYKGRVVSVEANLQAAFVDIGTGKNAFLPFSEIHPEYYASEADQDRHWKDLAIKKVIQEGQELLIEVVKEATGNKGANMTTFLSLPGRYVVLLIGSSSKGISRQIDNREQRTKLREMLESCKLPEGVGYIIRTASKNITKKALTTDVRFLINLWKDIKEKGQSLPPASLVYQEQNVVARFLRDHFTEDIQEILVDSQDAYSQVSNFIELLPAAQQKKTSARLHKGPRPLLNSFNVEEQIEQIYQPTVKLPSGGSIVINPTEALVAIDVNSGRTDKNNNFEETIFLANMEAAEELARQLQLRDLGGLIVVDFIDMRSNANIREVEKKVKSCMKRDKAKVDFCRISKFGLMQISRQKMAAPVMAGNYTTCEHCSGRGIVKSVETQALVYLRQIQTGVAKRQVNLVKCLLPLAVGNYLLNKKRAEIGELEKRHNTGIIIETDSAMTPSQAKIQFIKNESGR